MKYARISAWMSILLAVCIALTLLPTAAFAEKDPPHSAVDDSVDNSTTVVRAVLDPLQRLEEGYSPLDQIVLYESAPFAVSYAAPRPDSVNADIERATQLLLDYASQHHFAVVNLDGVDNPSVTFDCTGVDNRVYRWEDDGEGDRYLHITGDYAALSVLTVHLAVEGPLPHFVAHFDPRGGDEDPNRGLLTYQIGTTAAEPVIPEMPYLYADGSAAITFTIAPPADRAHSVPIIGLRDTVNDTDIDFFPDFSEHEGTYRFTLTPNALTGDENPCFEIFLWWSDYDCFGPEDNQFMLQTNVSLDFDGNPGGEIRSDPCGTGGVCYEYFASPEDESNGVYTTMYGEAKYIFERTDEPQEITLTFTPRPYNLLHGLVFGDEFYGFDGDDMGDTLPLPEPERPDGVFSKTFTIPAISEDVPNYLYVEAIYTGAQEQNLPEIPANLRWEGNVAKWDAVAGADNYGVRLINVDASFEDSVDYIFTGKDVCEFDFTDYGTRIYSSTEGFLGDYFVVFATKNHVRSEEASSDRRPLFRITFDVNGGEPLQNSSVLTISNGMIYYEALLPTPVREGYTFDGWFTEKDGGVEITEKTIFVEDTTVYAHWIKKAAPISFVDVPEGSYYEDAVSWAVENEITTGMDATHFEPEGICTRAQAVTFLWRAAGCPAPSSTEMPFTDVKAGSYYYDAVLWAVEKYITLGTTDTTFSPDEYCSRAQIVTFLWRSLRAPVAEVSNAFTDLDPEKYYFEPVLWAVGAGVTNGMTETTFAPDDNCTRAQIVTFIYRALAQ